MKYENQVGKLSPPFGCQKKKMVYFWLRHDWSWEIAEATEGLRRCFDKKGFLFEDQATSMGGSAKF